VATFLKIFLKINWPNLGQFSIALLSLLGRNLGMIGPTDHIKLLVHLELCSPLQPNYWGARLAKYWGGRAPGAPSIDVPDLLI